MDIYVIRHGETDWNTQLRLQGRSDTELNAHGRRLARLTGEALREIPFACAFSSPLRRAQETARLVLGERRVPVILDERLIEISFGAYEGLCCRPGAGLPVIPDPDFYTDFFKKPQLYRTPPGGESLDEVEARTADFLRELYKRRDLADKAVLISTHGCAMRGLINSLSRAPRSAYWGERLTPNCGVSLIEYRNGRARLIWENHIFYKEKDME